MMPEIDDITLLKSYDLLNSKGKLLHLHVVLRYNTMHDINTVPTPSPLVSASMNCFSAIRTVDNGRFGNLWAISWYKKEFHYI